MGNNRPGSSPSFVLVDFLAGKSTEEWTIPLWVVILPAATAVFGTSKHDTADTTKYFVWTNKIHVPNHQPVVRWVYHMFIHWFFDAIGASSSVRSESSSLTLGTYRIAACLWSSPGKRLTGASAIWNRMRKKLGIIIPNRTLLKINNYYQIFATNQLMMVVSAKSNNINRLVEYE